MPDPRQYVRPGQRLQIAASQINALNEMMRVDTGFRAGPVSRQASSPYTWVYGKSTSAVARWGVMAITGMEVTPTSDDNADATKQFESMPVLTLGATSSTTTAWCVAIEPIAAGKIGRVAISGAVQIKASDLTKAPSAPVLWNDSNWALIVIGGNEPRLGTISATWNNGATATVTQINADGSAVTPQVTFQAKNFSGPVLVPPTNGGGSGGSVSSGSAKVVCGFIGDGWVLIASEMPPVLTGTFGAPWNKGSSKSVTVSVNDSFTSITATNLFANVGGSGTKTCAVAWRGTEFVLIAAEC